MAETLKIADAVIEVGLDLSKYKQQLSQMSQQMSSNMAMATSKMSNIMAAGLGAGLGSGLTSGITKSIKSVEEATKKLSKSSKVPSSGKGTGFENFNETLIKFANNGKKVTNMLEKQKKALESVYSVSKKIAMVGIGVTVLGFSNFLKTTDMNARRLNGSYLRLKNSFFQLTANIGSVANAKFGIADKMDRLAKVIKSITKEDISKFLDVVKLAVFVTLFSKLSLMAIKFAEGLQKAKDAMIAMKAAQWIPGKSVGPPPLPGKGFISAIGASGGLAAAGATAIAALAVGAAFRAFNKDAETTKAVMSGLASILSVVTKVLLTLVEVVGTMTDYVGGIIGTVIANMMNFGSVLKNIGQLLKDIVTGDWKALKKDWKEGALRESYVDTLKSIIPDFKGIGKNFTDIWMPKPGEKGKQEQFNKAGSSMTGGFAELNSMFQRMFEENVQQGLITATDLNSKATNDNTTAVTNLSNQLMSFKGGGGVFGKDGAGVSGTW